VDNLLTVGLGNAAAAAVLAAAALAGERLTRRPAVAHALWLLVLVKLLTPPLWSVPLLPAPEIAAPRPAVDVALPDAPPVADIQSSSDDVLPAIPPSAAEWSWRAVLPAAWLGGAVLWWALAVARLWRFGRLLRRARPAPSDVMERARFLARRMGLRRCPGVWLVPAEVSPLLLAVGPRARVFLPEALWPRLTGGQREAILAHELAHLRRRDHWVRRLEFVVLGLYWWFPVAWLARRRLQDAEEQCCDAWVVRTLPDSAPDYAAALVETVAFLSTRPLPLPAPASGAGQVPLLKRRLTMILRDTPTVRLGPLGLLAVLAGAALLPLLPTWAQSSSPAEADPPADEPQAVPRPPARLGADIAVGQQEGVVLFRHLQESCKSCHQDPHRASGMLSPRWKPIHDDLAAVYERVQTQAADAPAGADREERIQAAQDELELMMARMKVRELQVLETRQAAQRALERLKRLEGVALKGEVSREEVEKAREEAEGLQYRARIQEAELQVNRLSLQQAERRLRRMQTTSDRHAPTKEPGPEEQRMRVLQQRAEKLLRELEGIRKEIDAQRGGGSRPRQN
jgi:beta-lactamase regulating signal transducer with metallopeptidase domain